MLKRFLSVAKVQWGLGIIGFFTLVGLLGKPFAPTSSAALLRMCS